MTHLEELLDELAPFGQTTTSIIQSSPVPLRGVALGLGETSTAH
jgi:Lrp/AsnC family leucine-responsive transcriptional regulator